MFQEIKTGKAIKVITGLKTSTEVTVLVSIRLRLLNPRVYFDSKPAPIL